MIGQDCSSTCPLVGGGVCTESYWSLALSFAGSILPYSYDLTQCSYGYSSLSALETCGKSSCPYIYQGSTTIPQDPEGDGSTCYYGGASYTTCAGVPDGNFRRFCPCLVPAGNNTNTSSYTRVPTRLPTTLPVALPTVPPTAASSTDSNQTGDSSLIDYWRLLFYTVGTACTPRVV